MRENAGKKGGRRWKNSTDTASSREKADAAMQSFIDMMVEKVKAVKGDWKKPWFSSGIQGVPRALFGDEYRGTNALITLLVCEKEGWDIPLFATFNRYHELNYSDKLDANGCRQRLTGADGQPLPYVSVRTGEKSVPVVYYKPYAYNFNERKSITIDEYDSLDDDEKKNWVVKTRSFTYPVFNIAQTNIKEVRPELWQKLCKDFLPREVAKVGADNQLRFEPADRMVRENKWIVPIQFKEQDSCFYSKADHSITMPLREQFEKAGDDGRNFYVSMWHECVHSALHEDKEHGGVADMLTQLTGISEEESGTKNDNARNRYGCEELAAELGGAYVAQRYGITAEPTKDSLTYLDSWLKNLREDPTFLKTAMRQMKGATMIISSHIDQMAETIAREQSEDLDQERKEDVGIDFDQDGEIELSETARVNNGREVSDRRSQAVRR